MKTLGIIPARYNSTRFPGKPLADICGKSMIRRVYEQACGAQLLSDVVVATDDARIFEHVEEFGGKVVLTGARHQSGTDRCAEVLNILTGFDTIINIQGDEPFIDPAQIDLLCSCFDQDDAQIATLVKKITDPAEVINPNIPKVVVNTSMNAIYFSRHPIPYLRDAGATYSNYYKHIGIYGYRSAVLKEITALEMSALEKAEALEQLRWIENGYRVKVAFTGIETHAVDTPGDLERIIAQFKKTSA